MKSSETCHRRTILTEAAVVKEMDKEMIGHNLSHGWKDDGDFE